MKRTYYPKRRKLNAGPLIPSFAPVVHRINQKPGDYLRCVADPMAAEPVSIPDLSLYPCQCFKVESTQTFPINAQGVGGTQINVGGPAASYFTETSVSTNASFSYSIGFANSWASRMTADYAAYRLVGMGVLVEYLGTDNQNSGKILANVQCGNATGTIDTTFTSLDGITNGRGTYQGPARDGVYFTWRPMGMQDFDYRPIGSSLLNGIIQIHVTGATTGVEFNVRTVWHYEGVTKNIFDAGVSSDMLYAMDPVSDPTELNATVTAMGYIKNFIAAKARGQLSSYVDKIANEVADYARKFGTTGFLATLGAVANYYVPRVGYIPRGGPPGGG